MKSPTSFTLTIELGNAAMSSRRDIARALTALASSAKLGDRTESSGTVRDLNGNTVGRWEVK